jgi:hypothetical protein
MTTSRYRLWIIGLGMLIISTRLAGAFQGGIACNTGCNSQVSVLYDPIFLNCDLYERFICIQDVPNANGTQITNLRCATLVFVNCTVCETCQPQCQSCGPPYGCTGIEANGCSEFEGPEEFFSQCIFGGGT